MEVIHGRRWGLLLLRAGAWLSLELIMRAGHASGRSDSGGVDDARGGGAYSFAPGAVVSARSGVQGAVFTKDLGCLAVFVSNASMVTIGYLMSLHFRVEVHSPS